MELSLWNLFSIGVLVLFILWFLWISRGTEDADPNTISYRLHRAWRRIAFWAGDVKVLHNDFFGIVRIPWLTWDAHGYRVGHEELLEACKLLKLGDIMLATKEGYIFSNLAIPGCFKHAGVIVCDAHRAYTFKRLLNGEGNEVVIDPTPVRLVEAISEGVVIRHPAYARADRMIFLRPNYLTDADGVYAAKMAMKMVGCKYDASFNFNIESEVEHFAAAGLAEQQEDTAELIRSRQTVKAEYDIAFSCTEVAATAWWHKRRDLGISRIKSRGRLVIVADQFVNRSFQVVWTNVTVDEAKRFGLHEEGLGELEAYWHSWEKVRSD